MGRKAVAKNRKQDVDKKQEWADALFPFFQQHGLKGITINKMAKWLEKSKSTLYEYFKSKEEIVTLALLSKMEGMKDYEQILNDEQISYINRYINFIQFVSDNVSDISNQFLYDLKEDYPDQWKIVDAFLKQMVQSLNTYYQGGITAGEFKNVNIALLLHADRYFIFDVLTNPKFLMENNLTIKEVAEQYLHLKFNGLKS